MTKKKKADNKLDLELKKAKEKGLKQFNADMKKLSKSDFADFKKGVIKQLTDAEEGLYTMYEMILMVAENAGGQRNMIVEEITKAYKKGFKDFDKGIEILDKRLSTVEMSLLLLTYKSMEHFTGKRPDNEWLKEAASMLSIDWDGTIEELQKSLAKKAPDTEPSHKDSSGA